ncbi:MAG: DUF418 domain-containing protein [Gammaproteobacteria bacterium]
MASVILGQQLHALDPELAILATTSPVPPMPLYMLAGSGAAALVIGLCLRSADWLDRMGVLKVVTPAGRQALSLYVAHILLGMGSLEALGMLGTQSAGGALMAALMFCLLAVVYARLWTKISDRGPLESIMRRIA